MEYFYSFLIVVGIIVGIFIGVGIAMCGFIYVYDWFENRFADFPTWLQIIFLTIKWAFFVFAIALFFFIITMAVHAQMFA